MSIYFLLFPSISIYVHLCTSTSFYFHLYISIYVHLCPSTSFYFHLFPSMSIYFLLSSPVTKVGTLTQSCKSWQSEQEMPSDPWKSRLLFCSVPNLNGSKMVEFRDVSDRNWRVLFSPLSVFVVGLPYFDVSICIVSIAFFALGSVGQATQTPTKQRNNPTKTLWENGTPWKVEERRGSEERDIRKDKLCDESLGRKELTSLELRVCTIMLSSALAWNVSPHISPHRQADFPAGSWAAFPQVESRRPVLLQKPSGWTDPWWRFARAFLVMTLMQSGYCLRADHAHEVHNADLSADLLESDSNVTFGKKVLPATGLLGDKVYEKSLGQQLSCKALAWGVAYPQKASPCKVGPNKYGRVLRVVLCAWLRRPHDVRRTSCGTNPWQRKYDNMWRKMKATISDETRSVHK